MFIMKNDFLNNSKGDGMKKLLLFLIFILSFNLLFSKIKIDLKTPIIEKAKLTHIKLGLKFEINNSKDFEIKKTGEDYSLWLNNYSESYNKNDKTIELDMELRTKAMFTHGKLVKSKHVMITYNPNDLTEMNNLEQQKIADYIQKNLDRNSFLKHLAKNTAIIAGVAASGGMAAPVIAAYTSFKSYSKTNEGENANLDNLKTLEGVYCGQILFQYLQEFFK
jgi:hypothetical protein